jgi:hypothetical protein
VDIRDTAPLDAGTLDALGRVEGVVAYRPHDQDPYYVRLVVDQADRAVPRVTAWLEQRGLGVESIRQVDPPFDDVFVALVEETTPR